METGKRYIKKQKTREKIIDVFQQLLSEKSFKDITVNDIIKAADINRSTFYTHFQDKYELFNGILVEIMNEIYEMVDFDFLFLEEDKYKESLKTDIKNILLYISRKKKILNVQKHSKRVLYDREVLQQVIDVFIHRMDEEPFSKIKIPLKKEYFAVYFINGLFAALEYWTISELDTKNSSNYEGLEEAIEQIASIVLLSFPRGTQFE